MNKKNIILIVCIILIILFFILYLQRVENNKEEEFVESGDITFNEINISESIKIKNIINKSQTSNKTIDIEYPEFQNLNEEYERYINSKIYDEINENSVYKNVTEGYESGEIGVFTYEADYDRYNCGDYVSIVINQYIHLGNSRPRLQKKCYVINANNNSTVTLKDVCANKTTYKKVIINEINNQAKTMGIELIGGNGLKELNDKQAFYIKDNKLVIYFESSEIAATAVGELEFNMPFEFVNNKFII